MTNIKRVCLAFLTSKLLLLLMSYFTTTITTKWPSYYCDEPYLPAHVITIWITLSGPLLGRILEFIIIGQSDICGCMCTASLLSYPFYTQSIIMYQLNDILIQCPSWEKHSPITIAQFLFLIGSFLFLIELLEFLRIIVTHTRDTWK